ncbi:MAG: hypothetical protein M3Q40_09970 [Pseudomonadota bacterium]|nr:hypothetical protein [Pseudomonadota bacterium]
MTTSLTRQAERELAAGRVVAAFELLAGAPGLADDLQALQMFAALGLRAGRHVQVRERLEAAVTQSPEDPVRLGLAAAVAHATGDRTAAIGYAGRAIERDPAQTLAAPIVVEGLAEALHVSDAIRVSEACLQRDPGAWGVRLARVFAWMLAGESARALEDAELARAAAPQSLPARMNAGLASLYLDEPAITTLARHASVAAEIPGLRGLKMEERPPYRAGQRPLRIGLVSADLRRHPVGMFIAPLLRHLAPQRVETVAYSDAEPDAATAALRPLAWRWHDTAGLADAALFERIQDDRIDVLVDLGGYTAGARPRLFATRCAPVQLGYLGYLHPLGLKTMDGLVGDTDTLDEQAAEGFEDSLRLATHMLCYEPPAHAPGVLPRAQGPLRFCSFNHLAKLSPATIGLWGRVLQGCPGSTLTLCALGLADAGVRLQLTRRFTAAGVEPDRLKLLPPETDPARFLALYEGADIALDPLPFNGGTTSLQALWQGVPVLTLPGKRMAARMGRSMMKAIGLPEFVARNEEEFVRIATRLGADPAPLAAVRAGLRERMRAAGITDGARFAEGFAAAVEDFASARLG